MRQLESAERDRIAAGLAMAERAGVERGAFVEGVKVRAAHRVTASSEKLLFQKDYFHYARYQRILSIDITLVAKMIPEKYDDNMPIRNVFP
jgi:hypothetical protein